MYEQEQQAKNKMCMVTNSQNPGMRFGSSTRCLGSGCMTYWRWANAEHSLGYCSLMGKPEY